uniref:Extensin-like n=1 Tax=Parastrongyloides trichosuri TaxID=131310 RepID=A0A0N4ZHY5_PARTI
MKLLIFATLLVLEVTSICPYKNFFEKKHVTSRPSLFPYDKNINHDRMRRQIILTDSGNYQYLPTYPRQPFVQQPPTRPPTGIPMPPPPPPERPMPPPPPQNPIPPQNPPRPQPNNPRPPNQPPNGQDSPRPQQYPPQPIPGQVFYPEISPNVVRTEEYPSNSPSYEPIESYVEIQMEFNPFAPNQKRNEKIEMPTQLSYFERQAQQFFELYGFNVEAAYNFCNIYAEDLRKSEVLVNYCTEFAYTYPEYANVGK